MSSESNWTENHALKKLNMYDLYYNQLISYFYFYGQISLDI